MIIKILDIQYCLLEMEAKLKKQASLYFKDSSDYQLAHQQASKTNSLNKFYLLLIVQLLDSGKTLNEITITLHSKGALQGEILLRSVWAYTLGLKESSPSFKTLAVYISDLNVKSIVDRNLMLTILPQSLVDAAGVAKKSKLDKEARVAYTKYYYDQNKHNLFRESNEGFSKLTLLLATLNSRHKSEVVEEKILSLIGNYDLDPDRVLDLVIESFVQSNSLQIHFHLIKKFKPESITTVIGHRIAQECKLQNSQKIVYAGSFESFLTTTPDELYRQHGFMVHPNLIKLAGMLIKRSIITLESIFPFLLPHDSVQERLQAHRIEFGKEKIAKAFKIMLQETDEQERRRQKNEDQTKIFGQLLFSSKYAIISELVRQNDWQNFKVVWEIYRNKLDLLNYQPLLHALYNILEWIIQPLYEKISFARYFKSARKSSKNFEYIPELGSIQLHQAKEANEEAFQMIDEVLSIISEYIGLKSELYIKLCRLFRKMISEPQIFFQATAQIPEFAKNKIRKYIYEYIMPGTSYQVRNQVLANQAFDLLSCFEYQFRYSCYAKVYKETIVKNPYQAYIFEKTKNKQNIIVNNLSEENKKLFTKKMAKLTHNQSLQVFYWIFRRLMMEDYEAVVPQIVAVLSGSNSLTLEIVVFIILHCLTEQKQPTMNFKTGEQLSWFKNITKFTSLFFRKYLDTDISPIFDFIIMKLSEPITDLEDNEELPGSSLLILKALLNKMFGNFMMQDINKNKYDIICAGQLMQSEAMYLTSEVKAARKSKVALQNFFWQSAKNGTGSLSFNLLILLAQKRAEFMHITYVGDLKIMGDIYDNFSSSIVQLVRFLNYQAADYEKYAKLLPPNFFDILLNQYKIPLEIAFQIYRPAVKNISFMENEQLQKLAQEVSGTIDKYVENENKFIEGYNVDSKLKNYLSENLHKINKNMSKVFFTTFWFLTADSIHFPEKLYTDKIEELRKKIEMKMPSKRTNDRDEKDLAKAKSLFEKLKVQEEQQRKKHKETMSPEKVKRFQLQFLRVLFEKGNQTHIQQFAEVFVQICLLPRILMDPSQAYYCFKFTTQMIKANAASTNLSSSTFSKYVIKLLTFIIEYVMNYLPFATEKEASNCLSVFLSEILGIFINWNDINKLKADLQKHLEMDPEVFKEEKYLNLKKYLLILYERVGNLIKSIKDEPYNIKNCLYLLEKVDSIPGYKQQAEDLETHMKELKQRFPGLDMKTILERQITMLNTKKQHLPEKTDEFMKKKINTEGISNSHSKKDRAPSTEKPKASKVSPPISQPSENQKFGSAQTPKAPTPSSNLNTETNKSPKQQYSVVNQPKEETRPQKKQAVIENKISNRLQQKNATNIEQIPVQNVQQNAESVLPPLKTVADRKLEMEHERKQKFEPLPMQTPSQGSARIPTVKEFLSEKAKKAQESLPTPNQKDLNEKFKHTAQDKNQALISNQKEDAQNQSEGDKPSKQIEHLKKTQQNKINQRLKGVQKSPIKQKDHKNQQVKQVSSLQQNLIKEEVKGENVSENKEEKIRSVIQDRQQRDRQKVRQQRDRQDKDREQRLRKQQKIPQEKQKIPKEAKVIQIKIQNKNRGEEEISAKNPSQSNYQEETNRDANKGNNSDNKTYKLAKYSRDNSHKRDSYYQEKEKGRQRRDKKDSRDKDRSKSKDRYRYKDRDEYRQRQQDRRKQQKDRSHRRQDKYEREKRHDSKGSKHNRDRDRHYHK